MRVGLDIGSTTIKCVVLNENDGILYSTYERHFSHILEKAKELLQRVEKEYIQGQVVKLAISGSAGMGLAESCGVPFVFNTLNIVTSAFLIDEHRIADMYESRESELHIILLPFIAKYGSHGRRTSG